MEFNANFPLSSSPKTAKQKTPQPTPPTLSKKDIFLSSFDLEHRFSFDE